MVKMSQIRRLTDALAAEFRPERIVLFGSYAKGNPTRDSDVDLLFVMPHEARPHQTAAQIRAKCDVGYPLDILVRSKKELEERLAIQDPFFLEVLSKGVVLHEAAHARVDR